ncbi:hypothetical protein [uncultured Aquimarina sp.]|uniref:hypothetical protein n=1 Tax=uncultured Aquimarina sp. TaxID=575652 RepID=UPI00263431FF|nr:hypothetical protein [uncultured Aquimarina sp.]
MNPNFINPTYVISVNTVNCQLELKCNGIHLFEYKSKSSANGNGISISLPINHLLLKNKDFSITAKVLPVHSKDSLERTSIARFQILMLDYIAPKKTMTKLFEISTPDQTTKNSEIKPKIDLEGLPFYQLLGESSAKILPFQLDGWSNSIDLSSISLQKLLMDTFNFYQKVQSIINKKNIERYLEITTEQDQLLQTAYYYGPNEIKKERQMVEEIFNEVGLNVIPFNFHDLEMELMGKDNQLVRLKRKNGLPVLSLYNPLNQKTVKLDIKLHKKTINAPLSII